MVGNNLSGKEKSIDITLGVSDIGYNILSVPRYYREFFPGYKIPFVFNTNVGSLEVKVTSAPKDTKIGDPRAGNYIVGGLSQWYYHNKTDEGDKIRITQIKKHKKYELKKLKK